MEKKCEICGKKQVWRNTGWGTGHWRCEGKKTSCVAERRKKTIDELIESNIGLIEKYDKEIYKNNLLTKRWGFPLFGSKDDFKKLKKVLGENIKIFLVEEIFQNIVKIDIPNGDAWKEVGYYGYGQAALAPIDDAEFILRQKKEKGISLLRNEIKSKRRKVQIGKVLSSFKEKINGLTEVLVQEKEGTKEFRPDFQYRGEDGKGCLLYVPKGVQMEDLEVSGPWAGICQWRRYWAQVGPVKNTEKKDENRRPIYVREVFRVQKRMA